MKSLLYSLSLLIGVVTIEAAKPFEVYWVDVEGGAATLMVTPAGESILMDTGNPGHRDAARIHKVATEVAGLKKIDHLVTSHFHLDHFGGAEPLTQLMPIGTVHDNGLPKQSPDKWKKTDPRWPIISKPYRNMKVDKRNVIKPGEKLPLKQVDNSAEVSILCVVAQQDILPLPKDSKKKKNPLTGTVESKKEDLSDNANSVGIMVSVGEFRFLDLGDLTWNVEAKLVAPYNRIGVVDVYQVNHHGLDVSNNPLLVKSVRPTVSIMNNGHTKGCQPETFATLASTKSIKAMYQVHKNLRKDSENNTKDEYIANKTHRDNCAGHYVKLSIAPDGDSYTFSIPAHGHSRTFETKSKMCSQ